jgi:hypothetical protein
MLADMPVAVPYSLLPIGGLPKEWVLGSADTAPAVAA